ncbi:MAG: hypothetical protein KF703_07440 [Actinobacteria bacterium]|nr:hypothetical protein [Actinomycetota bacterium]
MSESAAVRPTLVIRCSWCGAEIALAGYTKTGPLFTSSWPVIRGGSTPPGAAEPDGGRTSPPPPTADVDGVVALASLPPDLPDDYPLFLVRCRIHGDAALEPSDVAARVRSARPWFVAVTLPFRPYRYHDRGSLHPIDTGHGVQPGCPWKAPLR